MGVLFCKTGRFRRELFKINLQVVGVLLIHAEWFVVEREDWRYEDVKIRE